eukprot:CAMPEP_0169443740 /NCGR_PEP_ID=MMETSP1042-20121227/9530_1 /TAXON_ID=464988 /ORGANISM="Hemiselmis andersenii, Strain CCMP1180" /LENGTH=108 /DNA_ID=CAMNT_0009555015 /DNA_START=1569 /DNA_END=1895 /DNA_ORIENTATION=-
MVSPLWERHFLGVWEAFEVTQPKPPRVSHAPAVYAPGARRRTRRLPPFSTAEQPPAQAQDQLPSDPPPPAPSPPSPSWLSPQTLEEARSSPPTGKYHSCRNKRPSPHP